MGLLSQAGGGLSHKSYKERCLSICKLPPTIISPWAQWHPRIQSFSWCLPLSAESSRQAGRAAGRAHKPWLPVYGDLQLLWWCSLTVVYFGVGQFLARIEINTAVRVNAAHRLPSWSILHVAVMPQKAADTNPSQKCQLANMWEGKTWRGITFGRSSSLLGTQKHYKWKNKNKKQL